MEQQYFAHETACIDEGSRVGRGSRVWHFCHLMKDSIIGENCNIGQNVFIASGVVLGNNVKVQNNVSLYTGVTCEDDVFLGPSMVFTNVINPRAFVERKDEYRPTLIKKGASIGANATLVCGSTIGKYALVGAGSLVARDVPDYALVYGVPASQKGWVCCCGEKLVFTTARTACNTCHKQYIQISNQEIRED